MSVDGFRDPIDPDTAGVVRSGTEGKTDFLLALDGPLLKRWARHMTYWASRRGGKRNWMSASTQEDLDRFRESLLRHTIQFLEGEEGEEGDDHAAAICFNLNGILYVQEKLKKPENTVEIEMDDATVLQAEKDGLVIKAEDGMFELTEAGEDAVTSYLAKAKLRAGLC